MLFEILGPLRCGVAPQGIDLPRRREGRILAALLLCAGRVVAMHNLVVLLWGERPPATARQQVQNCVTNLVRALRAAGVDLPLERTDVGYQVCVDTGDLDAAQFEAEVTRAGRLLRAGDQAAAAAALRVAVGRWRGPVLQGIELGPFGPAAVRLEELRLKAVEQRFAIELQLGRNEEVLADLAEAVGANPYRERLVSQYMVALAGAGRVAEALAVFHRTRRILRSEYAIEPGRHLQAAQLSILRDGPGPPGRGQLPVEQHQRLVAAIADAEAARQRLEVVLREARVSVGYGLTVPGAGPVAVMGT